MRIGELARRSGLTVHTLRYDERIGLLPYPNRNGSGLRNYDAAILTWIAFLGRLHTTGMPIRAMRAHRDGVRPHRRAPVRRPRSRRQDRRIRRRRDEDGP